MDLEPRKKPNQQKKHGLSFATALLVFADPRPVKKQLTLRLDADLIAWFRDQARDGEGYGSSINKALQTSKPG